MARYKNLPLEKFKNIVNELYQILSCCTLCGHKCKVNRMKKEKGECRSTDKVRVASYHLHFGEERPISGYRGSGTIFFSYCNLHCVYCQNYDISQLGSGEEIDDETLSQIMLELQSQKAHNINLVSPTHFVPQIVNAIYLASQKGLNLPIVYNTGGYDSIETIKLLDGIIDIYMPDMKYSDNENSLKYSGAKNYFETNTQIVKEMYRQVGDLILDKDGIAISGLLVRHLVLPYNIAGSKKIIDFISEEISKNTYVNIMAQYRPCYKAYNYISLNRPVTATEYFEVVKYAEYKKLNNVDKEQMVLFIR